MENLGKKYILNHQEKERYVALRDVIANSAKRWGKRVLNPFRRDDINPDKEEFWALKNVSFEIQQGDRVGIIGRNGAGKSTLLKLLSRITEPTAGRARIRGRVASLLEVGTGFHPELTGRENIYLNGAILGMSREEIKRKFDEIVDFAEVDKFLDTPVKRYSSGMYVRLAFAVAAHLEPEILIVDEVLAVGDAQFQQKCLGKMESVGREGRTVLFVSHNMQAIKNLCDRVIILNKGKLIADTTPLLGVPIYLEAGSNSSAIQDVIANAPPDPVIRIKNVELRQDHAVVGEFIANGSNLEICVEFEVYEKTSGLRIFFDLQDMDANLLFRSFHDEQADGIQAMLPGCYISRAIIPANLLAPINYQLIIYSTIFNIRYCEPRDGIRLSLRVERTGLANKAYLGEPIRGKLAPMIDWCTKKIGLVEDCGDNSKY